MVRSLSTDTSFTTVIIMIILISISIIYLPQKSSSQIPFINNNSTNTIVNRNHTDTTITPKTTMTTTTTKDYHLATNTPTVKASIQKPVDKFGVKKLYPTKKGGREWYINMDNPKNDSIFHIGSGQNLIRQSDGSWSNTNPQVRMHVSTPSGLSMWKNVEITGYVKVTSIDRHNKGIPIDIAWLARGNIHNDHIRCDGTALNGGIHNDGTVGWKKEIWFPGGYTDELAHTKVTDTIVGRWIGWKVVIYNINNDSAVKMESYLDDNNNDHWIKVTDLTDNGGWYANSSDKEFYSAECGKPKDHVLTNAGPIVAFRSDNMIADFTHLSVREIQPFS
jgi:hypothetical protein